MNIISNNKFSILSVTKENIEQFKTCLDAIIKSNNMYHNTWDEMEPNFFERHPTNSFLAIKQNDLVVGLIYGTPHKDYACYEEFSTDNLDNWGINYLIIHKDYQKHGLGTFLFKASMQDINNKGGKTVSFMPNRKSIGMVHNVVKETNMGPLSLNNHPGTLTLHFNLNFLTGKTKLFNDKFFNKTKTAKSDYDLYDYYFTCEMDENLAREYFGETELIL